MKRLLYCFFITFALFVFSGCGNDDDIIWDISPAQIVVRLVDRDGNNLLDPNVRGNWVNSSLSMAYDDVVYPAIWNINDLTGFSRAYLANFYGLVWPGMWGTNASSSYVLKFGEFQGEDNKIIDATFMVEPLNCVYEIRYVHKFVWKNKTPHFDDHIYLNGKEYEGNTVEIILPVKSD